MAFDLRIFMKLGKGILLYGEFGLYESRCVMSLCCMVRVVLEFWSMLYGYFGLCCTLRGSIRVFGLRLSG
jgi:hypothetical protein